MLDTTSPFRRSSALKAGITPKQLRGPRFRQLFGCVYIEATVEPDPLHRVKAALLIHKKGAFASHASAGRVYEVPLPSGLADEHVSVFAPEDRRRREGIRNHVVPESTPSMTHRGIRVSTPSQTFVELADQLTLVDLVVVGDHLVRHNGLSPEQLVAYCSQHGPPAARAAAAYVRSGVEYDGRQHRADLEQWDHDVERGEWLDDDGWRHVPVFSWGIYKRPDHTLERVRKALVSRGCKDLPRTLSDDWRAHFPVRSS